MMPAQPWTFEPAAKEESDYDVMQDLVSECPRTSQVWIPTTEPFEMLMAPGLPRFKDSKKDKKVEDKK